jgi:hypothetical protein
VETFAGIRFQNSERYFFILSSIHTNGLDSVGSRSSYGQGLWCTVLTTGHNQSSSICTLPQSIQKCSKNNQNNGYDRDKRGGWLFTLGGLDQKARDRGGLDRALTGRDLTVIDSVNRALKRLIMYTISNKNHKKKKKIKKK